MPRRALKNELPADLPSGTVQNKQTNNVDTVMQNNIAAKACCCNNVKAMTFSKTTQFVRKRIFLGTSLRAGT